MPELARTTEFNEIDFSIYLKSFVDTSNTILIWTWEDTPDVIKQFITGIHKTIKYIAYVPHNVNPFIASTVLNHKVFSKIDNDCYPCQDGSVIIGTQELEEIKF